MLRSGVSPDVVKSTGRWRSDSFLRYWRNVDSIVAEHVDLVWPTVQFSDGAVAARPAAPFGKRAVGSLLAGHEGVAKAPISVSQDEWTRLIVLIFKNRKHN